MRALDLNKIEIKTLDSKNVELLDQSIMLLNRTQGKGLFNKDYLLKKSSNSEAISLAIFIENRLISVGCAELINKFDFYKPFDDKISKRLQNKTVGSLCTLSVHEDYQGKGIGQIVTKKRMDWLKNKKCDLVFGVSWVSGLRNTSDRVFEKLGFRAVNKVEAFFKETSIKRPFECPGCKAQPCRCSAILYEYHF